MPAGSTLPLGKNTQTHTHTLTHTHELAHRITIHFLTCLLHTYLVATYHQKHTCMLYMPLTTRNTHACYICHLPPETYMHVVYATYHQKHPCMLYMPLTNRRNIHACYICARAFCARVELPGTTHHTCVLLHTYLLTTKSVKVITHIITRTSYTCSMRTYKLRWHHAHTYIPS